MPSHLRMPPACYTCRHICTCCHICTCRHICACHQPRVACISTSIHACLRRLHLHLPARRHLQVLLKWNNEDRCQFSLQAHGLSRVKLRVKLRVRLRVRLGASHGAGLHCFRAMCGLQHPPLAVYEQRRRRIPRSPNQITPAGVTGRDEWLNCGVNPARSDSGRQWERHLSPAVQCKGSTGCKPYCIHVYRHATI